ncbi:hypothetical protein BDN72DRAFT_915365 [Pluteus cervinus]|uniref:Uncharacterized protein n=1 Tax=Pluteus cervinus TaxID=181527 RepID=A0ACD2ZXT6_9AGAR|nr:hypothetical protein BDN72DRAFT_915365 [Pluteus cervinus]
MGNELMKTWSSAVATDAENHIKVIARRHQAAEEQYLRRIYRRCQVCDMGFTQLKEMESEDPQGEGEGDVGDVGIEVEVKGEVGVGVDDEDEAGVGVVDVEDEAGGSGYWDGDMDDEGGGGWASGDDESDGNDVEAELLAHRGRVRFDLGDWPSGSESEEDEDGGQSSGQTDVDNITDDPLFKEQASIAWDDDPNPGFAFDEIPPTFDEHPAL